MGKKKGNGQPQNHQTLSFGQMVSKAALIQLAPEIEQMVKGHTEALGQQLAQQTANTIEMLYLRVLTLEDLLMEKLGVSKDELAGRVATREDKSEGLEEAQDVQSGDVLRIEIKTKTKDQTDFQGSTRMKVYQAGSGKTLGKQLEDGVIGMKTGESKQIEFGQNNELLAEISLNRVSRPIKQEAPRADQAQG